MKTIEFNKPKSVTGHQTIRFKTFFSLKIIGLSGMFFCLMTGVAMAQNGNLTVLVSNLKDGKGMCHFELWNTAEGFPTDDKKALKIVDAPVTGTTSRYVFENLPAGTYAVTIFDDENNNHKFDTNFLGIPKERYGATNGARGGITAPPKFKKASFVHGKTNTSVAIKAE